MIIALIYSKLWRESGILSSSSGACLLLCYARNIILSRCGNPFQSLPSRSHSPRPPFILEYAFSTSFWWTVCFNSLSHSLALFALPSLPPPLSRHFCLFIRFRCATQFIPLTWHKVKIASIFKTRSYNSVFTFSSHTEYVKGKNIVIVPKKVLDGSTCFRCPTTKKKL